MRGSFFFVQLADFFIKTKSLQQNQPSFINKERRSNMQISTVEYPALIYKSAKNNGFVANCIIKKLIGFGRTEKDAISNLESMLNSMNDEYFVKVKPMYNLMEA